MRLNEGVVHNLVLQGRVPTRAPLVNVCACAHSLGAVHDFFTKVVSQGFLQKRRRNVWQGRQQREQVNIKRNINRKHSVTRKKTKAAEAEAKTIQNGRVYQSYFG